MTRIAVGWTVLLCVGIALFLLDPRTPASSSQDCLRLGACTGSDQYEVLNGFCVITVVTSKSTETTLLVRMKDARYAADKCESSK